MVTLVARAGMDFHSNRVAPVSADSTEKNMVHTKIASVLGSLPPRFFKSKL